MTPDPLALPADPTAWADWLDQRGRGELAAGIAAIEQLRALTPGDPDALARWNDAGIALGNASAIAGLLSSVHPDAAVMELAEAIETEVRSFVSTLFLDPEVHRRLAALEGTVDGDAAASRVLGKALRSFRRSGVDRDEETRARVTELDRRLTELSQAFGRNIRDGRRVVKVPVSALEGLPEDYQADHPADADGLVELSTDYPDLHPFLTFSTDHAAREELARTSLSLAWPENDAVLGDLLAVRRERATLLGYPDWPTYDAEVKMIGSGEAIIAFIDDVTAKAEDAGRRDLAVLAEKAAEIGISEVNLASWRYLYELLKRERYGVDAQALRQYFEFSRVRDGLLDVTGRLFGIEYHPVSRAEAPTWHEEVDVFDVTLDSAPLGRIYLDLHPRERKYNHAAQFTLVDGIAGRQVPEGVLVCNFNRGLLSHGDVVTLFHEFGHLLHHLFAGHHAWSDFAGVATEWDFVEAPSQLLEEWAWDTEVLQTFARNEAGEPIPANLVAAMRRGEEFCKGLMARTQMFYAAVSYRLHRDVPEDLDAAVADLYQRYHLLAPLPGTHFQAGFGHLDGYGSGYYTYMWSLVIAKDLMSAFDRSNLMDAEVAGRYRDRILAPGGSKDAADLVADFLGRPYTTEAFAAWLND